MRPHGLKKAKVEERSSLLPCAIHMFSMRRVTYERGRSFSPSASAF
jgi:hypothetical protein